MIKNESKTVTLYIVGGDDLWSYYNFKNDFFTNSWIRATLFSNKETAEIMAKSILEKYLGITGIHVRALEDVEIAPTNQIKVRYGDDSIIIDEQDLIL